MNIWHTELPTAGSTVEYHCHQVLMKALDFWNIFFYFFSRQGHYFCALANLKLDIFVLAMMADCVQ